MPHTLIPVITSTYYGKYAIPFYWATLYRECDREQTSLWVEKDSLAYTINDSLTKPYMAVF